MQLREGFKKKKKKLTEFSVKVGGWGHRRTNFPFFFFFFFFNENISLNPLKFHFKTNLFFFNFFGGGFSPKIMVRLEARTSNFSGRAF